MIRPDYREIKAVCNSENEILHYGVKGMKWGVHRRLRKLDRLDRKIAKNKKKSTKNYIKAIKKESSFKKANDINKKLKRDIEKRDRLFKNLEVTLDEPAAKKKGLKLYSSTKQESLRREVENRRLPGEDRFVELMELLEKKQMERM